MQKSWQSKPIHEDSFQIQWRTSSQTRKTKIAPCTSLEEGHSRLVSESLLLDFDQMARDSLMEVDTAGIPLAVSRLELVQR